MNSEFKKMSDCDIIGEQIRKELKENSIRSRVNHPFNYEFLWRAFKITYKKLFGINYAYTENSVKAILDPLLKYFLEDLDFYDCENLFQEKVVPTYKKGLFIAGPVGIGKTKIMKCFEYIFKDYPPHRFKIKSTLQVVQEYEVLNCPNDKADFFNKYSGGTILFDDLHSEELASNYGKSNVMHRIIMNRERIGSKTHFTMNPFPGLEQSPKENLLRLENFYDARLSDRLFEMCNYITLTGKTKRF